MRCSHLWIIIFSFKNKVKNLLKLKINNKTNKYTKKIIAFVSIIIYYLEIYLK